MIKSIFSSRRQKRPHRMEGRRLAEPFFTKAPIAGIQQKRDSAFFQPKLAMGQPDDKYEREADTVADSVVGNNHNSISDLQPGKISRIQRLSTPEEEDKLGTNDERMRRDKEIQEKPEVQLKCAECEKKDEMMGVQKVAEPMHEEEEFLTRKPEGSGTMPSRSLSGRIESSAGKGKPMPGNVLKEMNSSFDADFSQVTLHTDDEAVQLNRQLGAQAFTVGRDIYFNLGKFNPQSSGGKHLLAHELTHTLQQGSALRRQKKKGAESEKGKKCSERNDRDLLPAGVGLVEHINREVVLTEALGMDRDKFESRVRKDKDARAFVCQYGISGMLALYYHRDYKNELRVDRAREGLNAHPEYYLSSGFDKREQTKSMLEKKYGISIERGNKAWSPRDIVLLAAALGKLTERESSLLHGYHFIRWTTRCDQLREENKDYSCDLRDYAVCGRHDPDIIRHRYSITMFDCMGGDVDDEIGRYNIEPGTQEIVHEIGHAMEFGRSRLAIEKFFDAKKDYEQVERRLRTARTAQEKANIRKELVAVGKVKDKADAEMQKVLASTPLDAFKKLVRGRRPLTEYSKESPMEAFAEAFMLFKVAPEKLRKANRRLYSWFKRGGFT